MKLLATAEDSGSLKLLECVRGTDTSKQGAPQPTSITNYCKESRATKIQQFIIYNNKFIVATRVGGSISIYSLSDYELVNRYSGLTSDNKELFVTLFQVGDLVYSCTNNGQVIIINPSASEEEGKEKKKYPIKVQLPGCQNENVSCFKADPYHSNVFGYGGKENDLKLIRFSEDFRKIESVFKAKNVSNNKLDLREPIHITKLEFVKPENETKGNSQYKTITVTKYGQLRLYDSLKSRKPFSSMKISTHPIMSLLLTSNKEIVCSDDHTTIAKYSTEDGRLLGKFKGSVGAIQTSYKFDNLIATGGLDRYVRVFDLTSRELIVKCFLGTQINAVHVLEDDEKTEETSATQEKKRSRKEEVKDDTEEQEESEQESSDEEGMWSKLESNTVVEKRKRRKLHLRKDYKK